MYVFHFFFSNCNVLKMGIFDHETTKQAYRDGLVVYLSFSSHNIYIFIVFLEGTVTNLAI